MTKIKNRFADRTAHERRMNRQYVIMKKGHSPPGSSVVQREDPMCSGYRTYVFETPVLVNAMQGLSCLWNGRGICDNDQIDAVLVLSQLMRHPDNRLVFTDVSYKQLRSELDRCVDTKSKVKNKHIINDMFRFLGLIDLFSMHLSSSSEDNDVYLRAARTNFQWAFKIQHGPCGIVTSQDMRRLRIKPNTPAISSAAHASAHLFSCTVKEREDERRALYSSEKALFYHHHLFTFDNDSNPNLKKPGIVFDTSTLVKALDVFNCMKQEKVSSLRSDDILSVYALMFAINDHTLWFTHKTFSELEYIVQKKNRKSIRRSCLSMTDQNRNDFLSWIVNHGCIVDAGFSSIECDYDPNDTMIVDTVFANSRGRKRPRLLISDDWHLLAMDDVPGVRVCDPERYLSMRMHLNAVHFKRAINLEAGKIRKGESFLFTQNPLS